MPDIRHFNLAYWESLPAQYLKFLFNRHLGNNTTNNSALLSVRIVDVPTFPADSVQLLR
jgi:hypothetical protein